MRTEGRSVASKKLSPLLRSSYREGWTLFSHAYNMYRYDKCNFDNHLVMCQKIEYDANSDDGRVERWEKLHPCRHHRPGKSLSPKTTLPLNFLLCRRIDFLCVLARIGGVSIFCIPKHPSQCSTVITEPWFICKGAGTEKWGKLSRVTQLGNIWVRLWTPNSLPPASSPQGWLTTGLWEWSVGI